MKTSRTLSTLLLLFCIELARAETCEQYFSDNSLEICKDHGYMNRRSRKIDCNEECSSALCCRTEYLSTCDSYFDDEGTNICKKNGFNRTKERETGCIEETCTIHECCSDIVTPHESQAICRDYYDLMGRNVCEINGFESKKKDKHKCKDKKCDLLQCCDNKVKTTKCKDIFDEDEFYCFRNGYSDQHSPQKKCVGKCEVTECCHTLKQNKCRQFFKIEKNDICTKKGLTNEDPDTVCDQLINRECNSMDCCYIPDTKQRKYSCGEFFEQESNGICEENGYEARSVAVQCVGECTIAGCCSQTCKHWFDQQEDGICENSGYAKKQEKENISCGKLCTPQDCCIETCDHWYEVNGKQACISHGWKNKNKKSMDCDKGKCATQCCNGPITCGNLYYQESKDKNTIITGKEFCLEKGYEKSFRTTTKCKNSKTCKPSDCCK
eukprot:Awhi_evm1s2133